MGADATTGPGQPAVPPPPRRTRPWVPLAVVALLAAGVASYYLFRAPNPPAPTIPATLPDDDADLPPAAVVNPGYVGVDACAACHAKRVGEFRGTRHMVAATPPRPNAMPRPFADGRNVHQSHEPTVRFEMSRENGNYLVTAVRDTPQGEERFSSRIGMVYGSGGVLDEVFFSWRSDRLYELPVTYLHPQDCWANVTIPRHGAGDFSREATARCMECHNTWFEHVPGSTNRYRPESFVHGIGCERCHGPGREHVAHHQAHPGPLAAAIVHPGHLSRERLIDVCAQCHSNTPKRRGPALTYRPGQPLEQYYRTSVSRHPEEDHVANQTKYMRESKCFQKSATMTCVTCHDPHRPTDHAAVQKSCAQCHQPENCREQPKLPAAVRADCVGCHMPPRVWMNVHFHTADDTFVPPIRRFDHRIGVYPEAMKAVLLAWHRSQGEAAAKSESARLANELTDYWLREADGRAADRRYLAAIGAAREALRVEPSPSARDKLKEFQAVQMGLVDALAEGMALTERQQYPAAVAAYERVLARHPDNAVARGRVGALYAAMGQTGRATEHLRAVARCDPNDAYGENLLGWIAYQNGRPAEAVEAFRRAEEIEPFSAELRYRWGLSLLQLGRFADAEERFRVALAADPDHAGAHQGLSHALREQVKLPEAVAHARRAVRLTDEKSADVLVSLADAYAAAGRLPEGVLALEMALAIARGESPDLARAISAQLADLRKRLAPPAS